MSYEIIKSIKIKDSKVFFTSKVNNICPGTFQEWECKPLSEKLQEEGREAVDIVILKDYESGNIQKGNNKYTKALKILQYMLEYKDFNWRLGSIGKGYEEIQKRRDTQAFNDLLRQALNSSLPKDKFILSKQYGDGKVYLWKLTSRRALWTAKEEEAKTYNYKQDLEKIKSLFKHNDWEIIKVL